MKNYIFAIITLFTLMYLNPALAEISQATLATGSHPISGLIGDWYQFRANLLAKTKQYDKYSDIKDNQVSALPGRLVGSWRMQSNPKKPGYQLHAKLNLKANNTFTYQYQMVAGPTLQEWDFSGQWDEKNKILMLLIDKSTYPGEEKHDILFWRLLHIGKSRLVYVKTGADKMFAMKRSGKAYGT